MAQELDISSDFEVDFLLTRKNATTRAKEPATGLSGVTARFALSRTGSAIGGLTASLAEAGTSARYIGAFDAAALTSALTAYLNTDVFLICSKSGDIGNRVRKYRVVDSMEMTT